MSVEATVSKAKELLANASPEEALQVLSQHSQDPEYTQNVNFLNVFGEALVENSSLEEAFAVYNKSVELDPEGQTSTDAFFNLGQIIGGFDGLQYMEKGCKVLEHKIGQSNDENATRQLTKLLVNGVFAQIEIWMTDLCMEPEAESKCEALIQTAKDLDSEYPETWSLSASIRISQQRFDEARQDIEKSWRYFSERKSALEDGAECDGNVANSEYIELVQPMLTLSRNAAEVAQFELAAVIAASAQDVAENFLEPYYLEAFSYSLAAKEAEMNASGRKLGQDPMEWIQQVVEHKLTSLDGPFVKEVYVALAAGSKVMYNDDTADSDIVGQFQELITEFGGAKAVKKAEKEMSTAGKDEEVFEEFAQELQ